MMPVKRPFNAGLLPSRAIDMRFCGGTVADYKLQQLSEIRRLGREERRDIVSEAGLSIEIPPDEGLAMRSERGIPWNKIRNMRSYVVRPCLLFFSKSNEQEIRLAACAQVYGLKSLIYGHIEENMKFQKLTWHDGLIPSQEIWLKIGGDK
ncbi:hypothetical protein QZH41_013820, partial [Actinostola sp. cb2023]